MCSILFSFLYNFYQINRKYKYYSIIKRFYCIFSQPIVTRKPSCLHYIIIMREADNIELSQEGYKSWAASVFERYLSFFGWKKFLCLISIKRKKGGPENVLIQTVTKIKWICLDVTHIMFLLYLQRNEIYYREI